MGRQVLVEWWQWPVATGAPTRWPPQASKTKMGFTGGEKNSLLTGGYFTLVWRVHPSNSYTTKRTIFSTGSPTKSSLNRASWKIHPRCHWMIWFASSSQWHCRSGEDDLTYLTLKGFRIPWKQINTIPRPYTPEKLTCNTNIKLLEDDCPFQLGWLLRFPC